MKIKLIKPIGDTGEIHITDLVGKNVAEILCGVSAYADRSLAVTIAAKELYGWGNWAAAQGIPLSGQIADLIQQAAIGLGVAPDRVQRILAGVDPSHCSPAMVRAGGEIPAWRRIQRLNWDLYRAACPMEIQQEIRGNLPQTINTPIRDPTSLSI